MSAETVNAQQAAYWTEIGGPHWVRQQRQFDHMLAPFGGRALAVLAAQPGERALDIGCGTGTTTTLIADSVEASGHVTGVDISPTMIDGARQRVSSRTNVSFRVADVQVDPLTADSVPVDAVFSRFGVMFFADPVAAFANIAASTRGGGRLVFVCWRAEHLNPWIDLPAQIMRRHTPEPVYPPPNAPGPFGFQDSDRVADILARAGWTDASAEPFSAEVTMGEGAGVEPALTQTMGTMVGNTLRAQVDASTFEVATAEVRVLLEAHMRAGSVVFPGNAWIFSAVRR